MTTRVAMVAPHFPPAYLGGGPIKTLSAMVENAADSVEFFVLTSDRDHTCNDRLHVPRNVNVPRGRHSLRYVSTDSLRSWYDAIRWLRSTKPHVVYLNGYFNPVMSIMPRVLSKLRFWAGDPIICIAPRGEFDPGALRIRSSKKRLFGELARRVGLDSRCVWHASTEREAAHIRDFIGSGARILVRENETLLPRRASMPLPRQPGALRIVFVSRLSQKKGLHTLLQALRGAGVPVVLDVFGGWDDQDYRAHCEALMEGLPDSCSVTFHGPVLADNVRTAFAKADAFVFPTAGENFGHVIAESLSVACPVVVADVTPWTELISSGAGMVVRGEDVALWSEAIRALFEMGDDERVELKKQAASLYDLWRSRPPTPSVFEMLRGVNGAKG